MELKRKSKPWIISSLPVVALAAAFAALGEARAQDRGEAIENSVGVFITPRGQQYFEHKFNDVLFRNGYSIDEGDFEKFEYKSTDPLVIDNLPEQYHAFKSAFDNIRGALREWLVDFQLHDPKLEVSVEGIHYSLKTQAFGLRADLEATRNLGQRNSVVLVLEMEVPELRVDVAKVRVDDLNNSFLGTLGMNKFRAAIDSASEPLKIQMPFTLEVNPDGGLQIQEMQFSSNFDSLTLASGFEHPLLLPQIELRVNGHRMPFDKDRVEKVLIKNQRKLLGALQKFLKEFAEKKIPEVVNAKFTEIFSAKSVEVNQMNPPGADNVAPADKFVWGLTPSAVDLNRDHLMFSLSGFMDNPKSARPIPVDRTIIASRPPEHLSSDPANYDVALALNEGFINRALQLSYLRGYFHAIDVGDGQTITLDDMPRIELSGRSGRNHAIVHLNVETQVDGFSSLFVNNPVKIQFDLDFRFEKSPTGGLMAVMDHVDLDSIKVSPSSVGPVWGGAVRSKVKKRFKAANDSMRRTPRILSKDIPIPPSVFGIPLKMGDFEAVSEGYLVMYLYYNGV